MTIHFSNSFVGLFLSFMPETLGKKFSFILYKYFNFHRQYALKYIRSNEYLIKHVISIQKRREIDSSHSKKSSNGFYLSAHSIIF